MTRAVWLVDELATLPELGEEIEVAGVSTGPAELAAAIRELIQHLRVQAVAIANPADWLERIAAPRGSGTPHRCEVQSIARRRRLAASNREPIVAHCVARYSWAGKKVSP